MTNKSKAAAIIDTLTAAYDDMVTFTLYSTQRSMKDAGITPPRNNAVIIRSEFARRAYDTPIARQLVFGRGDFTDIIITTVSTHLCDAVAADWHVWIDAALRNRVITAHD